MTEFISQDQRPEPPRRFVELAFTGKNAWWRYVLGFTAIIVGGLLLSMFMAQLLTVLDKLDLIADLVDDPSSVAKAPLEDQAFAFSFLLFSIIIFLVPFFLFVPFLHGRSWKSFISNGRFHWSGFRASLGVSLIVPGALLGVGVLFDPEAITMSFDPVPWLVFAAIAFLLMPFQVLAEEVMTRGYLMQMIARSTKSTALRLLIPALAFAALHGMNTEVGAGGAWALGIYMLMALYLGYLVIWGNGLEYALGFHLGNNLFVALIASSSDSSFITPAIFMESNPEWGPMSLVQIGIFLGAHFIVMQVWTRLFGGKPNK